jgi:uncharacterized protein (TIGR02453 family)
MLYFSKKTIDFLQTAGDETSPEWLAKHKKEHTEFVIEPLKALAKKVSGGLSKDPLARRYRLPRQGFGRLRRPERKVEPGQPAYRNWVKLQGTRPAKSIFDENPLLYFFLSPTKIFSGAGFYDPSSRQIKKMRAWMADDPGELVKILKSKKFAGEFPAGLATDKKLKTLPRFYPPNHKRIEWLRLQAYYVNHTFTRRELYSKEFGDLLLENWKQGLRLNELLYEIWQSDEALNYVPGQDGSGAEDPDSEEGDSGKPVFWDERF